MGKLEAFLSGQRTPARRASWWLASQLTFAALETLLGVPLPATAQTKQDYWTATIMARHDWLRHRFRASLERRAAAVTFTRQPLE